METLSNRTSPPGMLLVRPDPPINNKRESIRKRRVSSATIFSFFFLATIKRRTTISRFEFEFEQGEEKRDDLLASFSTRSRAWRDIRFPRYAPLTASFFSQRVFSSHQITTAKFLAISLFLFFFLVAAVSCVQGVSIDLLVICTLVECCCMCWLSIFCTGEHIIYIYIYVVWRIIKKMLRVSFQAAPLDREDLASRRSLLL